MNKVVRVFLFFTGSILVLLFLIMAITMFFQKPYFEKNSSYWAEEQPTVNPPLTQDLKAVLSSGGDRVDIAIIGGGYTGLSSAIHLAKSNPELRIALFEAREVGSGASGRNGGMILPMSGWEMLQVAYDLETHKLTYDITSQSMQKMKAVVDSSGVDADLVLDGFVTAILSNDYLEYYKDYVSWVNSVGIPLEFWDANKTKEKLGTELYCGAVYDPSGGSVHAMKLIAALKKAAEKAGVTIYENSEVTHTKEGEVIELTINNKYKVDADAIVLAANGYISKLGYFKNQVTAVHTETAATYPLTEEQLKSINWSSRLPFFDTRDALFHLVLTPDNRIIIGGGNAEYFYNNGLKYRGDINKIGKMLHQELVRMYPTLSDIKFEYVWSGVLGMSFDDNEGVGVMGEHQNIYYALAYNGHGVNLSFLFGEVIASLYNGEDHPWFYTVGYGEKLKFIPPEPFRSIGAKTLMKYYKIKDKRMLN